MIIKKSRYFRGYKFFRIYIGESSACLYCNLCVRRRRYDEEPCSADTQLKQACRECEDDLLSCTHNDNHYSFIPTEHVIKEI